MAYSGDRRKRWNESCMAGGAIMAFISFMLICSGCVAGHILGSIGLACAVLDFREAKVGWKMKKGRPPWADKHDAIDRKHGITW